MRKKTAQLFAKSLNLKPVNADEAKARGIVPLESVLAKRDTAEIVQDMEKRSRKRFGK